MLFFHALAGIFGILLVVAIGWLLARKGWFSAESRSLLPRLVTVVSLPPCLAYTMVSSFKRDDLFQLFAGAFLPLALHFVMFGLAWLVGRVFGVQRRHFGLFCTCVSNSNTIFVGIPVNLALFGQSALPYVLLYYFASTIFLWTVSNYAICSDGEGGKHPSVSQIMHNIFSPPMLGFLAGMAIIIAGLPLPDFLLQAAKSLGDMTTPLALIYLGVMLHSMDLSGLRLDRDIVLGLAGRLVVFPLCMLFLVRSLPIPELMGKVFVIQSSLPVLMQAAILSAYHKTDPEYGALMVSLSTLLSVVTIPVFMVLL